MTYFEYSQNNQQRRESSGNKAHRAREGKLLYLIGQMYEAIAGDCRLYTR